jgi:hypothetical protein
VRESDYYVLWGCLTLPLRSSFRYNHKTGEWAHSSRMTKFPERKWLSHIDFLSPDQPPAAAPAPLSFSPDSHQLFLTQALDEAQKVLQHNLKKIKKLQSSSSTETETAVGVPHAEALRWFILPSDFIGSLPVIPERGTPYLHRELTGPPSPPSSSPLFLTRCTETKCFLFRDPSSSSPRPLSGWEDDALRSEERGEAWSECSTR